jgi:hypothetical protein
MTSCEYDNEPSGSIKCEPFCLKFLYRGTYYALPIRTVASPIHGTIQMYSTLLTARCHCPGCVSPVLSPEAGPKAEAIPHCNAIALSSGQFLSLPVWSFASGEPWGQNHRTTGSLRAASVPKSTAATPSHDVVTTCYLMTSHLCT